MIHALKVMGDYVQENSDESLLSQVVENPNSTGKYNTVLVIVFKEEEGEVQFDGIRVEEFTEQKLDKYAFKGIKGNQTIFTPTYRIYKNNGGYKKTYGKIQKCFKKYHSDIKDDDIDMKQIKGMRDIVTNEEKTDIIFQEIDEIGYDEDGILTVGLKKDSGEIKYVGDFNLLTKNLVEESEKKFYYKYDKKSTGENNLCYICSKKNKNTYGFVCTFSYTTYDKPGFIAGGFNQSQTWKNYPVCPECAKTLDLGKDYLERNLSARFCGINYFIIPKTIFSSDGIDREELFEILEDLEERRKMSLEEDNREALTNAQDDIFEVMSEFDNYINFNLMFYEEQNSAFRILLYIEDVLPSYIKKIFEAKQNVDKEGVFKDLKGKEEMFNLEFKFNLISNFFYVGQINKPDFTKQFLEITNSIFRGQEISYQLLIDRFISHLQEKFRNNEITSYDNLKALMILKFLMNLGLLSESGEEEIRVTNEKSDYRKRIDDFLDQHSDVLNSNVKRMVFLEGVLAQKLLNIQRRERDGATPFRARLNGLKLNEKIVKRLYSEIINKLEEYDKNYYKQLEEMIADYILESNFEAVSNNELSFYFVTGMNQAHKFQFENNNKEDDE